jgi:hypothetical protein
MASTTFAGHAGKFAPGFQAEPEAGLHEQVMASAYALEPLQRSCFSWYSWQKVSGAVVFVSFHLYQTFLDAARPQHQDAVRHSFATGIVGEI